MKPSTATIRRHKRAHTIWTKCFRLFMFCFPFRQKHGNTTHFWPRLHENTTNILPKQNGFQKPETSDDFGARWYISYHMYTYESMWSCVQCTCTELHICKAYPTTSHHVQNWIPFYHPFPWWISLGSIHDFANRILRPFGIIWGSPLHHQFCR